MYVLCSQREFKNLESLNEWVVVVRSENESDVFKIKKIILLITARKKILIFGGAGLAFIIILIIIIVVVSVRFQY